MNVLHCSMLLRSISQFKHIHINPAAQCEVVGGGAFGGLIDFRKKLCYNIIVEKVKSKKSDVLIIFLTKQINYSII